MRRSHDAPSYAQHRLPRNRRQSLRPCPTSSRFPNRLCTDPYQLCGRETRATATAALREEQQPEWPPRRLLGWRAVADAGRSRRCETCFRFHANASVAPRYDGRYSGVDVEAELRFRADGTLTWDAAAGEWTMYGSALRVTSGERRCEGAIGPDAIYLQCAGGGGRQDRSQVGVICRGRLKRGAAPIAGQQLRVTDRQSGSRRRAAGGCTL